MKGDSVKRHNDLDLAYVVGLTRSGKNVVGRCYFVAATPDPTRVLVQFTDLDGSPATTGEEPREVYTTRLIAWNGPRGEKDYLPQPWPPLDVKAHQERVLQAERTLDDAADDRRPE